MVSRSPSWRSILEKSTVRALTRGGVPVLNRRRERPSSRRQSVRAAAANMPSGPPSRTHWPTMVLPLR